MNPVIPRSPRFPFSFFAVGALLACFGLYSCATPPSRHAGADAGTGATEFAIGADLSFLGEAEAKGVRFADGGVVKPGLQFFSDRGYT